jgi:hypothetical protein
VSVSLSADTRLPSIVASAQPISVPEAHSNSPGSPRSVHEMGHGAAAAGVETGTTFASESTAKAVAKAVTSTSTTATHPTTNSSEGEERNPRERKAQSNGKADKEGGGKKGKKTPFSVPVELDSDYQRPYKCRFKGCGEAFSRMYTLKIHEDSHELFERYHTYKRQPQLFLDGDSESLKRERERQFAQRTALSPMIQLELDKLIAKAEARTAK